MADFWDSLSGMYNEQKNDPLAWLSAAGSLAGIGSNVYNAFQGGNAAAEAQRQQEQARQITGQGAAQLNALAATPIAMGNTYAPMSDAARAAILRGTQGDLATRGVSGAPQGGQGGYWDSVVAEAMAKAENERFVQSRQLDLQKYATDMQNRAAQLQAMQHANTNQLYGNLYPGNQYVSALQAQANKPAGSMMAYPQYAMQQRMMQERQKQEAAVAAQRNAWQQQLMQSQYPGQAYMGGMGGQGSQAGRHTFVDPWEGHPYQTTGMPRPLTPSDTYTSASEGFNPEYVMGQI